MSQSCSKITVHIHAQAYFLAYGTQHTWIVYIYFTGVNPGAKEDFTYTMLAGVTGRVNSAEPIRKSMAIHWSSHTPKYMLMDVC